MHHIYVTERGGVHIVDLLIEEATPVLAVKKAEAAYPGKSCRYICTMATGYRVIRKSRRAA